MVVSFASIFVIYRKIKRLALDFIVPKTPGEPSSLANSIDAISVIVARAFVAQLKTTFMGMQSGDKRAEQAIQGDIALDVAGSNPMLSGILAAFPHLSKTLRRNPALLDTAMGILSKMGKGGSSAQVPSNGNGHQVKFKL
jgi:hypothetical protein